MQGQLVACASSLYSPWIEATVAAEKARFEGSLSQVSWHEMSRVKLGWQLYTITEQSEKVRGDEDW